MTCSWFFLSTLLYMFRMLVHPSSRACDLLWIYFMCCIALVRCVLVLRCGSAGVVWYPYAGWSTASACIRIPKESTTWDTFFQCVTQQNGKNCYLSNRLHDITSQKSVISTFTTMMKPKLKDDALYNHLYSLVYLLYMDNIRILYFCPMTELKQYNKI